MTMTVSDVRAQSESSGWFERLARRQVHNFLHRLRGGCIELIEQGQEHLFGEPHAELQVRLQVQDSRFYTKLLLEGSVGAGEAYMDGWWDTDQLTALIRLFARNLALLDELETGWARWSKPALKWWHRQRQNSRAQSKQNIAAHYDLGNDFYQLFLDPSMMYSSAVYPEPSSSLAQAQQYKLKLLCDDLQLSPDDHLMEIGTGWGGLAIFAASQYGCKVTTTTISEEQYQFAKQRIEQLGLSEKITLLKQDYRDLTGQFDKLISIEMIEAVGDEYLDGYFAKCASLLKPNGLMALQAITIADQRFEQYRRDVDFIQKFIFPGGFLPSIARMSSSMTNHSDLVVRQLRDIGLDYAKTLADWRQAFHHQLEQVRALGYPERFIRMWEFYLCYCEGGFLERRTSTVQLLLAKPESRHRSTH